MSDVTRDEVKARLGDPARPIVDVLPKESYAEAHIPGALSLPLADVEARARAVLPDPRADIVVYCGSDT
ncbi:MAG: rhodanese-like domain-containing protein [Acidobacteriota bacterium]